MHVEVYASCDYHGSVRSRVFKAIIWYERWRVTKVARRFIFAQIPSAT